MARLRHLTSCFCSAWRSPPAIVEEYCEVALLRVAAAHQARARRRALLADGARRAGACATCQLRAAGDPPRFEVAQPDGGPVLPRQGGRLQPEPHRDGRPRERQLGGPRIVAGRAALAPLDGPRGFAAGELLESLGRVFFCRRAVGDPHALRAVGAEWAVAGDARGGGEGGGRRWTSPRPGVRGDRLDDALLYGVRR